MNPVATQFISCSEKGNLNALKDIHSNADNLPLICRKDYVVSFCKACYYGHLEVAKWLLSVKPDINISADDEHAFRVACLKGHLKVAKWLISVKPTINISVMNEYAFRMACCRGYLEVAKWLLSVHPNILYKYVEPYPKLVKQHNWNKRKYAVWLSSANSPNKNTLLYRVPQDISREIIAFV